MNLTVVVARFLLFKVVLKLLLKLIRLKTTANALLLNAETTHSIPPGE